MRKVFYSAAPCSLDDVLLDSYFSGMQDEKLDPKIVKLVKALLFAGIETISSCEGHPKNIFLDSFHYLKNLAHYMYNQKYSDTFVNPLLTSNRPIVELSPKTSLDVIKLMEQEYAESPRKNVWMVPKIKEAEEYAKTWDLFYEVFSKYKSEKGVSWVIQEDAVSLGFSGKPGLNPCLKPSEGASCRKHLKLLQQDALELAEFIFQQTRGRYLSPQ